MRRQVWDHTSNRTNCSSEGNIWDSYVYCSLSSPSLALRVLTWGPRAVNICGRALPTQGFKLQEGRTQACCFTALQPGPAPGNMGHVESADETSEKLILKHKQFTVCSGTVLTFADSLNEWMNTWKHGLNVLPSLEVSCNSYKYWRYNPQDDKIINTVVCYIWKFKE